MENLNSDIRLINGDCFEALKNWGGPNISLVVTDPPYEIPSISGGGTVNKAKKLNKSMEALKNIQDITKSYDIEGFANLLESIQKGNINAYFFCNKKQIPEYLKVYVEDLKCKFDIICWHKPNALPTYSNKYLSDTEYLLYFHKGKGQTHPESYEDAKTFFLHPINLKDKKKYGHPSIKPLELVEKIIRNSSNPGECVLDPFMGSGTTGVACLNTGRRFIGYEISPQYYKISEERIKETLPVY